MLILSKRNTSKIRKTKPLSIEEKKLKIQPKMIKEDNFLNKHY
jgi:hypothetical protein